MAADTLRQSLVGSKTTVVVKVGTNVLTNATGELDRRRIESLAEQISRIRAAGHRIALVSSGAIGAGVGKLGLGKRPTDLPHLQACAAVGQSALMQLYQEALNPYRIHAAQILLTASDFDSRVRYLNMRNTISTLFEFNALPIINENDTVSIAEIKFGDNDQLAAMVANLLHAPLLVLLTNVDGLYSGDPRSDANARLQATVPHIDAAVTGMAGTSKSSLGTGGMKSKLKAARLATAAGGAVIMANGSIDGILDQIFRAEAVGTLFLPHGESIPAWKRWLGFTAQSKGQLVVDAGAAGAICQRGTSLLPVGVRDVQGDYGKGDVVTICDSGGKEIARGLTNYTAADTRRIMGRATDQIIQQIGNIPYVELVHRDNLVVTG
ncbi:glutamate 5-kinase [Limnoglobus roseus]|uniref:Glutamate 5-kinase n=1 Tax=Limnoglobus roseus TaxID=2598579 RepID=A0A5C1ACF5_9BACT|nr:glutamate 5-kinase [Limnoglobus roseus]QEL16981.1 glutamate 5-kinase [Limnoglobus roseus]